MKLYYNKISRLTFKTLITVFAAITMTTFSILTWNVRGVMSSSLCLTKILNDKHIDIALISEHKLLPYNTSFMDSLDNNFSTLTKCDTSLDQYDLLKCGKAGVAIMYHKKLEAYVEPIETDSERIVGLKLVGLSNKPYFIFSVYMPASNSIESYRDEIITLNTICNYYLNEGYVVVGGDMNASLVDNQNINVSKSNILRTFVQTNNMCCQYDIKTPRLAGPNYTFIPYHTSIDYILMDSITSRRVACHETIDEGHISSTSDHLPIVCKIKTEKVCSKQAISGQNWIAWNRIDQNCINKYQDKLKQWSDKVLDIIVKDNCDIDCINDEIVNIIHLCANSSLPIKKVNKHTKPFWNDEVKTAYKSEQLARNEWLNNGQSRNRDDEYYVNYKNRKKIFRRVLRKASQTFVDKSITDIQNAAECDVRLFWKLIKAKKVKKAFPCLEIIQNEHIVSTPEEVLSSFGNFYSILYDDGQTSSEFDSSFKQHIDDEYQIILTNSYNDPPCDLLENKIECETLKSFIKNLKKLKAPGWDKIQNEHIIYGGTPILQMLLHLFNNIVDKEYTPLSWKKGIIIPIFKGQGKSRSNIDHYRPVTLLPVIQKLYEKVIQDRIDKFLIAKNIDFPNKQQQGFQKGLGCLTAEFNFQEVLQYNIDRGGRTYVACMDIRKAYDTVWHNALFMKIYQLGIVGKIWRIIVSMYDKLQSVISINNQYSDWFPVKRGIRQGGVQSSFCYLAFINDMINDIQNSNLSAKMGNIECGCPALADDVAVLANNPNDLQKIINIIYEYSKKYRFEFNCEKSNVIVFGKSVNKMTKCNIKLGNKVIPQVTSVTHLGFRQEATRRSLDRTLESCKKAKNAFYAMSEIGVRPTGLNPIISVDLYKKIIIPTFAYGCELWNNLKLQDIVEIQKFQHQIVKKIQGFNMYVRSDICESMVGLFRLTAEIDRRKMLFLYKLCTLPPKSLTKQIFLYKLFFHSDGSNNPCSGYIPDIMTLLKKYNLNQVIEKYIKDTYFPSKLSWKIMVNKAVHDKENMLLMERLNMNNDFDRFKTLHIRYENAIVYTIFSNSFQPMLMVRIAKLWTMKPNLLRKCPNCDNEHIDILKHIILECEKTWDKLNEFLETIRQKFGEQLYIELCRSSSSETLNKLLGLCPTVNMPIEEVQDFQLFCYKLLKTLTDNLVIF